MLTEVDIERIMAAKRRLFEQVAEPDYHDIIDDHELLDSADYEPPVTETNGLM